MTRQTARIVTKKVYWLAAAKSIMFDNTFSSEGGNLKLRLLFALLLSPSLAWIISTTQAAPVAAADAPTKPVDFNREVRPILSDTCFSCHGPDEKQRMAKMRLDETEGLFVDRGGYKIITPGNAAQSKLY